MRRARKYTAMLRAGVFEFLGSQSELDALLGRHVVMRAEEFFCAPEEELQAEWQAQALRASKVPKHPANIDPMTLVTPAQRRRAKEYCALAAYPTVVGDVMQEVDHCSAGPFVCPLLHASILFSSSLGRPALPKEHLVMQGIPAYPFLCAGEPDCKWPQLLTMNVLSSPAIKKLAGLAMHVESVGLVIAYVLCRAVPRDKVAPISFRRLTPALSCGGEDSDDEEMISLEDPDAVKDAEESELTWEPDEEEA